MASRSFFLSFYFKIWYSGKALLSTHTKCADILLHELLKSLRTSWGEKDHGTFASAGGKCPPLGFATPSWWTFEDGREELRGAEGPLGGLGGLGWNVREGEWFEKKENLDRLLKSKKDERLLPSGCAGGIIGSLEALLAQKPYLCRHESDVRCSGRDAPENGASLVPSPSGCLAFEWLDRIFWSLWWLKMIDPKNWSVWFQPDRDRCPKEDTLCSELPALVKAWNLERLQMECETEAQQIVNTWNKSEFKQRLFTATKSLEASDADGTCDLGLEFSMALAVILWKCQAGLQCITRSSNRVWECVNAELSSRPCGSGVLRVWIRLIAEFFKTSYYQCGASYHLPFAIC